MPRVTRLPISVLALVVLCGLGLASSAHADRKFDLARQHFDEGTKAFNLGDFSRAVEEYKAAYKLHPNAVFLYNIAQSYRLANDPEQAIFFYRSYLRNKPNAANRKEVEERIRALQEQQSEPPTAVTPEPTQPSSPVTPVAPIPTVDSDPEPSPIVARSSSPSSDTPVYKKWWLWTVVGVAVVGIGLGVGLGVGLSKSSAPSSQLGTVPVF